jgi:D-sedoheptulose 7-phosphate isomerase
VHVFLEHDAEPIYSFLKREAVDPEAVLADVARSVVMKAEEATALRAQTLAENAAVLEAAGDALRACFAAAGRVLALGNGGSATDSMDVVADLRACGRPALDLTEDTAVITAVANDVGVEAIFSRQVIAHGRRGDVLIAISTSGGSANVIHALGQARKRGLVTIALVGYDGGRILAEGLADHVIVTRSEHIPRIQEAQATAYHALVRAVAA